VEQKNTFQQDKQLLWTALNVHGFAHDGTICPSFDKVPLMLEFMLILPFTTLVKYYQFHGIQLNRIPWTIEDDSTLADLPVDKQLPCDEWILFLLTLGRFLNKVMTTQHEAYLAMHHQFTQHSVNTLQHSLIHIVGTILSHV